MSKYVLKSYKAFYDFMLLCGKEYLAEMINVKKSTIPA